MLYSNSSKMKYTDMCIFFDENFYSPYRDDEKCYKYLYLIYYMLACKKKYFHKFEEYDSFAIFSANIIFIRFLKKQKNGEKIKSILNYAKATLYPLKVMYQKQEFREVINAEVIDIDIEGIKNELRQQVQTQYYYNIEDNTVELFSDIHRIVEEVIFNTPYKNNKLMIKRLYISCILSLLKSFTLPPNLLKKLNQKNQINIKTRLNTINKVFTLEREKSATLWHLNGSMRDYIKILTNIIRKKLKKEIKKISFENSVPVEILDSILMTAWEEKNYIRLNDDEEF